MPSIAFTGNILLQQTDTASPAPIPVSWSTTYTEKAMLDLAFTAVQANLPIASGSVGAPRIMYVEVYEGTFLLSRDPAGANPVKVSVEENPVPPNKAMWMRLTFAPTAEQWYLTTTGPAAGRVWFFE